MPANFQIVLDTLGPQNVAIALAGPVVSIAPDVSVRVTTSDADTTGYQVKFWGDVAGAPDEASAAWQALGASNLVTVTAGDGVKTIHAKLRDDVWNESAVVQVDTDLDTIGPFVTIIAGPDVAKVSKINLPAPGKHLAVTSWSADSEFTHYEVRVVPDVNSTHTAGALLVAANESVNVFGNGVFPANTAITTTVDGRDLENASPGDGPKVLKVFAVDDFGNWSV